MMKITKFPPRCNGRIIVFINSRTQYIRSAPVTIKFPKTRLAFNITPAPSRQLCPVIWAVFLLKTNWKTLLGHPENKTNNFFPCCIARQHNAITFVVASSIVPLSKLKWPQLFVLYGGHKTAAVNHSRFSTKPQRGQRGDVTSTTSRGKCAPRLSSLTLPHTTNPINKIELR